MLTLSKPVIHIMDQLKTLTLLDATTLVNQIEDIFDVDTSMSSNTVVAMAPSGDTGNAEEAVEEKTTFDIMVEDIASDKRVAVLKVIRKLTTLGLSEAKQFTTSLPKILKEGISKDEAEEAKKALEDAGAKVIIS